MKGIPPTEEPANVEQWADVVRLALDVLQQEVRPYGGEASRFREDGLVALFGAAAAHEDDPEHALLAALRVRQTVAGGSEGLAGCVGIVVQLRVA